MMADQAKKAIFVHNCNYEIYRESRSVELGWASISDEYNFLLVRKSSSDFFARLGALNKVYYSTNHN